MAVGKSFRPSDVVPSANDTYDLGSSDYLWNDIYVTTVRASAIAIPSQSIASSSLSDSTNLTGAGNIWALAFGSSGYSTQGINLQLQGFSAPTSDVASYGIYSQVYYGSSDDGGYSPKFVGIFGKAFTSIIMSGSPAGTGGEVLVNIGGEFACSSEISDEYESSAMASDFTQISVLANEPYDDYGDAYLGGTVRRAAIVSNGDVVVATGKKIYLEGGWSSPNLTIGDTYMVFNSGSAQIEFYINGSLAGHINLATGFVND